MTSVRGLRRLLHRHKWLWQFADDAGIHETCGRCNKQRLRPYFLVLGDG